jgi:hypothetical protein
MPKSGCEEAKDFLEKCDKNAAAMNLFASYQRNDYEQ